MPTPRPASTSPAPGIPGRFAPHEYPRRVLLAVTGLSPPVVTETLYALAVQQQPAFVPTEVQILTTAEGASRARLTLLHGGNGQFHRLCREYGLDPSSIAFDESHVQVLTGPSGAVLADIDNAEANTAVADAITTAVRELTSDPECALHASIAGGRKTMGFYLGYALSLYGRPQDRLSHVLVSAPFESATEFFYPPAEPQVLMLKGKPVLTSDARVMLAEIPFVRLRQGLDPRLANGAVSYSEVVAAAQAAMDPPDLTIDSEAGLVRAGGRTIALAPARLAMLAVFARRALAGEAPLAAPAKEVGDPDWARRYLAELRTVRGEMADLESTEKAPRNGMDGAYFSSQLSSLRRALRDALGAAAGPYLIDDGGRRPRRYRLLLPPEVVRFAPLVEGRPAGPAIARRAPRAAS